MTSPPDPSNPNPGPGLGPGRGADSKKRKRGKNASIQPLDNGRPAKQLKKGDVEDRQPPNVVKHALLAQYYPSILTLRQYVLDNLPASSKIRRKKIAALRNGDSEAGASERNSQGTRAALVRLLDTTLVGLHVCPGEVAKAESDSRMQQWIDYSQKGDDSYVTLSDGVASTIYCQSEIVEFTIWLLFSRGKSPGNRPHHLLCDGFRKNVGPRQQGVPSAIQGLYSLYFNERVAAMKESPWPQLLALLGKSGESIMINLLLDCSIFLPIEAGLRNYYQLSGQPIFEHASIPPRTGPCPMAADKESKTFERKPAEIVFERSRMLYARAALNARGLVHFGLRHIHALNRFPLRRLSEQSETAENRRDNDRSSADDDSTLRVMMYMFPRQFRLHNAFTSHVDPTQTAQKFQDYTLREEEIFTKFRKIQGSNQRLDVRVPKRLRGKLEQLVQRLQTLHARCSYAELLHHYCPVRRQTCDDHANRHSSSSSSARTAPLTRKLSGKSPRGRRKSRQAAAVAEPLSSSSLTELAVPLSGVSAFCQAVFSKIIPHEFWGKGDVQVHNRQTFLGNVDHFVKLRRFETMSPHEVMQGLKITEIDWLEPPGLKNRKCSRTDFLKRSEIFYEFLYYLFDSLLIPLIRSNFYVTESNLHRYRLFFFRHDVWRSISEPAMAELKVKMFEEVKVDEALRILDSRRLGYSQVRLLPKKASVRPIMNLRRRILRSKDKNTLSQSVNSILGPVHNMLKLEKNLNVGRLGSAMFSVGDIYARINAFKQRLGHTSEHFYFAKVDVQAAFDTIPQAAVIALMKNVPSQAKYEMVKYVEVQSNDGGTLAGSKVMRRWHSTAKAAGDESTFLQTIGQVTAPSKKNAVFVDSVFRKSYRTRDLLALMTSHIQENLVKIGKKYYRQKKGIPQGSVISSVLCNYFYADLERTHLDFLQLDDCLLLRLIDDFLLITTERGKASKFVSVMRRGMPEYGVSVSPGKTLVNFNMTVDGVPVPQIEGDCRVFPYCGIQVDCKTLDITKDRGTTSITPAQDPTVSNSLTVAFSRHSGQNFKRKVINAFKIQSHPMFFDSQHNSSATVLRNLHEAFLETATKAWAYARRLPLGRQPGPRLLVDTISDLVDVAFLLLTSRARKMRHPGYNCKVTRMRVRWLALGAFRRVLERKQAKFGEVLAWLDGEMAKLAVNKVKDGVGWDVGAFA